jgi:hypothetical protein
MDTECYRSKYFQWKYGSVVNSLPHIYYGIVFQKYMSHLSPLVESVSWLISAILPFNPVCTLCVVLLLLLMESCPWIKSLK